MLTACLPILGACQGSEDPVVDASRQVITFSSDMAEQGQGLTRATSLGRDFTVYGYKYIGEEETAVFPGWEVRHEGNGRYNYIGIGEQTIKFWDPSASAYRFWALTGTGWQASHDEEHGDWGKTLTVNNRTLRVGKTGSAATDLADDVDLYASLVSRTSPIDPSTVTLRFNHPYSQVSVYFYYERMQMGVAELQIKEVRFTPVATTGKAAAIFNRGNVQVQYPASLSDTEAERVTVTGDQNDTRTCLDFVVNTSLKGETGHGATHAVQAEIPNHKTDLVLPDMPGSDLATRAVAPQPYMFYYPLPMGEQNPDFELSMVITELDANSNEVQTTRRTAVIPATYMHWKPNYAYRYFFKITESELALQYDVKVEPWQYGGNQEDTWTNW